MSTFLQTSAKDFALSASKQLVLVTDPDQQAAQKLGNLFLFFLGEYFLDTRLGVPFIQAVLGVKTPSLRVVKQLFTNVILSVPWISSVNGITLQLSKARRLAFAFSAQTQSGATITGGSGQPFIVAVPT